MLALALVHTLQLGLTWKSKFLIASLWFPFYLAQLLEYHVGHVRTHIGNIGVTEGQIGQILIMIFASFMGGNFFNKQIIDLIPALQEVVPDYIILSDVVMGVASFNSLLFALNLIYEMISNIESISGKLYALWAMNPIVLIIVNLYLLDEHREFCHNNAALMIWGVGLIFTLITTKVIISSMAKMHISSFQFEPFLLSVYLYFQNYYSGKDQPKLAKYSFIITFIIVLALYLKFVRT